jgi:hypothetical protein
VRPPRVWGSALKATPTNGIYYHGGTVKLYFIWYGNFVTGPASSDSIMTQDLLTALFDTGGLGGTAYARINSTYTDRSRPVSGSFALMESANDYYSRGNTLNDAGVTAVVSQAISSQGADQGCEWGIFRAHLVGCQRDVRLLHAVLWLAQSRHHLGIGH